MKKIYIGASQMMGKSILWSLFDGHSQIFINPTHIPTGLFLLNSDAKEYIIQKNTSALKRTEDKILNTLKINYPDKSHIEMNIGDFFYLMFRFNGYGNLYCWAKNKALQINNYEHIGELSKFDFDINLFESLIEKNLFSKNQNNFDVIDVINIMQQNYISSRGGKKNNKPQYFIESLNAGYRHIKDAYENTQNSKFIFLKRNLMALCYSNMTRSNPQFIVNSKKNYFLKKIFFNLLRKCSLEKLFIFASQSDYYKKAYSYHSDILKHQNDKRVLILDFDDLILTTKKSMQRIADFIEISYEDILSKPTIDGNSFHKSKPIIGVINNDHLRDFTEKEINLVEKIYSKITTKSLFTYKISLYSSFCYLIIKSLIFKK